jgi:adenosylcobinamide-GDP ribazoletransferase
MNRFLAAIRFLTILPLPGEAGTSSEDLAGAPPFFIVVGLLLGLIAAGLAFVLGLFPAPVAAALMVAALLAFSGGLHIDGLSDMADGFLSSRPRERVLEIMKDSHVGAMGVAAVVCVLLVKFAALASLRNVSLLMAAGLIPVCGRCAIMLQMAMLTYVRPAGLGSVFTTPSPKSVAAAVGVTLAAGFILAGINGIIACFAAIVAAVAVAGWCHRRIGGATGDTLGAACELVETAVLMTLAIQPLGPWFHPVWG